MMIVYQNIENFSLLEKDVFLISKNVIFKNSTQYFTAETKYLSFHITKDGQEIIVDGKKTVIYSDNKIHRFNSPILVNSFLNKKAIFSIKFDVKKRISSRVYIDVKTGKKIADLTLYSTLGKTLFVKENFFLKTRNKNTIKKISYFNELLWQKEYQYPDYFAPGHERMTPTKLEKFLGVHENELWILFSNNRLLVLDTQTGEEIHHIPDLAKEMEVIGLDLGHLHFDKPNKKLKALAGRYYIEIDMLTKQGAVKKDFKFDESGLAILFSKFYEEDKNLYFICRPPDNKTRWKTVAGIFDTEALSVTWSYELVQEEDMHFFVNTPQANEQYFGVQDNKNNLYLFERTELDGNVLAPYL